MDEECHVPIALELDGQAVIGNCMSVGISRRGGHNSRNDVAAKVPGAIFQPGTRVDDASAVDLALRSAVIGARIISGTSQHRCRGVPISV